MLRPGAFTLNMLAASVVAPRCNPAEGEDPPVSCGYRAQKLEEAGRSDVD